MLTVKKTFSPHGGTSLITDKTRISQEALRHLQTRFPNHIVGTYEGDIPADVIEDVVVSEHKNAANDEANRELEATVTSLKLQLKEAKKSTAAKQVEIEELQTEVEQLKNALAAKDEDAEPEEEAVVLNAATEEEDTP